MAVNIPRLWLPWQYTNCEWRNVQLSVFYGWVSVNSRSRWQSILAKYNDGTKFSTRQKLSFLTHSSGRSSPHLYFYSNSEKMRRIIYLFFDEKILAKNNTPLVLLLFFIKKNLFLYDIPSKTLNFLLNLSHDLHSSIIYTWIRCVRWSCDT